VGQVWSHTRSILGSLLGSCSPRISYLGMEDNALQLRLLSTITHVTFLSIISIKQPLLSLLWGYLDRCRIAYVNIIVDLQIW